MRPLDYDRVRALFAGALERPPEERDRWIREAAPGEEALRDEVLSLLEHHTADTDFLDTPAGDPRRLADDARRALRDALRHGAPPPEVEGFRVTGELGRGGTGIVYLAEQSLPARTVALKVLDHVVRGETARARFRQESEVLARLDHPGIPRVHATGVTAAGSPWFAMELVEGRPLREVLADASVDRRLRVRLLAAVCDVVDHAHRHGVIHRDLKPENVRVDGRGAPWVLDFGIARVRDVAHDLPRHALTEPGQLLGTPAYMSPEQAGAAGPGGVDPRTDVYSLGVVLHEALAGAPPYETRGLPLAEALAVVREARPAPLAGVDDGLRTIVATALAKERTRRYATAADLAADLRRWLDHRPPLARAPGRVDRVRTLARRHRAFAACVATAVVLLLAAFAAALLELDRALESRRAADARTHELLALSDGEVLRELVEEADRLWPALPAQLDAYERWTARAERLLEGAPDHRAALDARRAPAATAGVATPTDPDAERAARWHRTQLEELVAGLDALGKPGGPLESVRLRRRRAARVHERTVAGPRARWAEVADAVRTSPLYDGLELVPQPGLVPLGPDPRSGLQEFAHVDWTGDVPRRDPGTGELLLDDRSALVFVLLPGGRTLVGAQADDPAAPRHDPDAQPHETPVHEVVLEPFLVSKYEMTLSQWRRLTGRNPRGLPDERFSRVMRGALMPVGELTWDEAVLWLGRLGMTLPTEARWEYAARGGTDTPWWSAAAAEELPGTVNAGGQDARRGSLPDVVDRPGMPVSVHAFPPNAFGLHHVLGNFSEYCLEAYRTDRRGPAGVPRAGDGRLPELPREPLRTVRGGTYSSPFLKVRVAHRADAPRDEPRRSHTARPVLPLVREPCRHDGAEVARDP